MIKDQLEERLFVCPATGHYFKQSDYNRIVTEYRSGIPIAMIARRYAKNKKLTLGDARQEVDFMIWRYLKLLKMWTT